MPGQDGHSGVRRQGLEPRTRGLRAAGLSSPGFAEGRGAAQADGAYAYRFVGVIGRAAPDWDDLRTSLRR